MNELDTVEVSKWTHDEKEIHYEIMKHIQKDMTTLGIAVPRIIFDREDRYAMAAVDRSCALAKQATWDSLPEMKKQDIEWRIRITIKCLAGKGIFLRGVESYYDAKRDIIYFVNFSSAYKAKVSLEFVLESEKLLPPSIAKMLPRK